MQTNNFSPEELIKSKTYCVHLFSQVATDPSGYLRPCCEFKGEEKIHVSKITPSDFFNSPYFQSLREKVNNGEKIKGCDYCYSMEEVFFMRSHGLTFYIFYTFLEFTLFIYESSYQFNFYLMLLLTLIQVCLYNNACLGPLLKKL